MDGNDFDRILGSDLLVEWLDALWSSVPHISGMVLISMLQQFNPSSILFSNVSIGFEWLVLFEQFNDDGGDGCDDGCDDGSFLEVEDNLDWKHRFMMIILFLSQELFLEFDLDFFSSNEDEFFDIQQTVWLFMMMIHIFQINQTNMIEIFENIFNKNCKKQTKKKTKTIGCVFQIYIQQK